MYLTGTTSAGTASNTVTIYGKPEGVQDKIDKSYLKV